MKTLLLICTLFVSSIALGQNCHCNHDTILKEIISCKPIIFNNHSKLFWSYNCDSSWLTFKGPTGKRKMIFSLGGGLVELTTRLGYVDFTEFRSTFLVTNNVISGCCDPQDYYVHDKISGDLIKYLGRAIFVSDDKNFPFVVSITNSHYTNSNAVDNSLTIYNLDTRKEYKISLPKGEIEKGMKNNEFMFPENVFETADIKDDKLTLRYFTEDYRKVKDLNYKTIVIDLKKYNR
jgi:hypothetical protein